MLTPCQESLLTSNQYIPTCTQETSQDVISATLSCVKALQNCDTIWITAVSDRTDALNLDCNLLDSRNYHQIKPQVILTAQKHDGNDTFSNPPSAPLLYLPLQQARPSGL